MGCENSGQKEEYNGETSKNAYTRGKQHQDEYRKQSPNLVLWRHCQERYNNERQKFTMPVTGQYRNYAMLRQIAESVRISNSNPDSRINNTTE